MQECAKNTYILLVHESTLLWNLWLLKIEAIFHSEP